MLPPGLVLSAFLPREDARDAFISRKAKTLRDLPQGAVVGTASLRRQALVKRLRPDLAIVPLRGNVETRLAQDRGRRSRRDAARRRRLEAARPARRGGGIARRRRIFAGGGPGRDRHRDPRRRRSDPRAGRQDRRRRHRDRGDRRARVSRRARRLLPHADRRPRADQQRRPSISAASSSSPTAARRSRFCAKAAARRPRSWAPTPAANSKRRGGADFFVRD